MACCYSPSGLGGEYIFVILCGYSTFERCYNKNGFKIFYNTVLKELPGPRGHETRRQLLRLIKSQQRGSQGIVRQMLGEVGRGISDG